MITLEKLIERAEIKGEAILNGRMTHYYGQKGKLEEKYAVVIKGDIVKLRHWGTQTLVIDTEKKEVIEYYGEGKSDRDSMNYMLSRYGITNVFFRYRPSIESFSMEER